MRPQTQQEREESYTRWLQLLKEVGVKYFGWSKETTPCPKSWRWAFDDAKVGPITAIKIDLSA
jgi:hypothetical protein